MSSFVEGMGTDADAGIFTVGEIADAAPVVAPGAVTEAVGAVVPAVASMLAECPG